MIPKAILRLGNNVHIDRNALLISEGALSIADDVYVGIGSVIVANDGISIERDVLIAAYVTIRDHDHGTALNSPFRTQAFVTAQIRIEQNAWIGAGAAILKGVTIGKDAIIGAGAVVTRSIPDRAIALGVPANARPRSSDKNT